MPTRYIKESARTSKNLSVVTDFAERLFWRLITTADDFGRFLGCPIIVKSTCFPLLETLKSSKIEQALQELHTHNLIGLYVVGDRQYGFFINWEKHQGKPRAHGSKYPDPLPSCPHSPASAGNSLHAPTDSLGDPNTNTNTNTNSDPDPESAMREFEQWFLVMPPRGKRKAYRGKAKEFYFKYVKPEERAAALGAAKAYAKYCQEEDRKPVDPHRFLNGQKGQVWREYIPVAPVGVAALKAVPDPPKSTEPFVPPPTNFRDLIAKAGGGRSMPS